MDLIPVIIAVTATLGFYFLVHALVHAGRLHIGLPIGLLMVIIGKYILLPWADDLKYFFWITTTSIPLVVFGALFGILGLGALVVKLLKSLSARFNKQPLP